LRLDGIPAYIISDQDSRFTSKFWKSLIAMLSIHPGMSIAIHPQIDGQKLGNNWMTETFLLWFGNLDKTDWVELLPLTEFAYNYSTTSTYRMTPFYPNYDYHLSSATAPT
jgi:hypothetical protein